MTSNSPSASSATEEGRVGLVVVVVCVCVCVCDNLLYSRVCAYVETIQSETLNSDKQGSDLPVNRAMLGLEAQPAACVIAL